ncbi:hypothetical protein GCM10010358_82620 [Streptomyces minutiscleroticus]|uniref:Uncharacterized protein n=1 Tax=Streptomyces minutiscleroticus TaxID=68238 RepID=A0A918UA34_9ACTN|nr:hypothetical protein GCM10010358_82620 [Streptomyces minutiscleroticus]
MNTTRNTPRTPLRRADVPRLDGRPATSPRGGREAALHFDEDGGLAGGRRGE